MSKKWFYAGQRLIKEHLRDNYTHHACNFQDVCKEAVYENYVAHKDDQAPVFIQAVVLLNPPRVMLFTSGAPITFEINPTL